LLDDAFVTIPPAYQDEWFGNLFRGHGRDPSWLASLLASDSYMEGYSARRLWQYAATLPDPELARRMRKHATDEARHSKIFSRATLKTFPTLEAPEIRVQLDGNAPNLKAEQLYLEAGWWPSEEEILTSMILVNLFEIKALVLGLMTKPLVIAHAPEANRTILRKMFDAIIRDEADHIDYSADYLERACRSGKRGLVGAALREFTGTMNELTYRELDEPTHLDGVASFPNVIGA
jgi:hypothetical protein